MPAAAFAHAALLLTCAAAAGCDARSGGLILATTTSTYDSGLLDVLIPAFEAEHDSLRVRLIAVGSGEALALGQRGDADVLLVHSPAEEEAFMSAGHGLRRLPVMHNTYLLVGPASDPAGVRGAADVHDAARRIVAASAAFISRGDDSGTHRRELRMWQEAGVPAAELAAFRTEIGQGMGETLGVASERKAYTLTDEGTFAALRGALDLVAMPQRGPELANRYSVIIVGRAQYAGRGDLFADWVTSPAAAAMIRAFGRTSDGRPLFTPASDPGS